MRLHLVALPHAHVTREITVCAFTAKIRKFCRMMIDYGFEVILYAGDQSDTEPAELVPLYSDDEQRDWYGDYDPNTLPIVAGAWDSTQPAYMHTNARAASLIAQRADRQDLVLLTGGLAQKPIADILPNICVEWAAGYSGPIFTLTGKEGPFVCFESSAWRHYLYGKYGINDGRYFDTVIPNFFDPDEWSLAEKKEDYLCFVGRLIARKGPHIAAEIARELELPLYVAGSGMSEVSEGLIVCQDGTRIEGDVHYMGTVGIEERNKLMGEARALIVPTTYIEPFGAVAIEGPLCGTPAVSTDFGAFVETVPRKLRFNTLRQGVEAVGYGMSLYPERVREQALGSYSLEAIAPRYAEWFERVHSMWGRGWYA